MDTHEIYQHGRARFEHAAARRLLKEKYQAKMVFAYEGGMWQAGPELLTLLESVPQDEHVVLLDLYENPVKINPQDLKQLAFERWQEQMTAWLIEHEEIATKR